MRLDSPATPADRCVIVVNSCDAYCDVWPLFLAAFKDHWTGCPFPLVINTESLQLSDPELRLTSHVVESASGNLSWGARLLSTLRDQQSEYVLMVFDDFILEQAVDQRAIERCIGWMDADPDISVFYLSHIPGASRRTSTHPGFEEVPRLTNYRLNSAPAIWRRKHLMELTRETDNPWIWELFGTSRTFLHRGKFLCAQPGRETTYCYNYQLGGAIYRGKWVAQVAAPLITRYGLNIDMQERGTVGDRGAPRSLHDKVRMVIQGFQASGWLAPVIIGLLLISKLQRRRKDR